MIATLLANDVFASSASASKLFLVANSDAMSVCCCFTIPCSQEVLREESRIAYKIPILAGNGPPQSTYGSFGHSKIYFIFLKHPTFEGDFFGQKKILSLLCSVRPKKLINIRLRQIYFSTVKCIFLGHNRLCLGLVVRLRPCGSSLANFCTSALRKT